MRNNQTDLKSLPKLYLMPGFIIETKKKRISENLLCFCFVLFFNSHFNNTPNKAISLSCLILHWKIITIEKETLFQSFVKNKSTLTRNKTHRSKLQAKQFTLAVYNPEGGPKTVTTQYHKPIISFHEVNTMVHEIIYMAFIEI